MSVSGLEANVAQTLLAKMHTFAFGNPALAFADPEIPFDASVQANPQYIALSVLWNMHMWESIDGSPAMGTGILQASVYFPKDKGIIKPLEIAGAIIQAWRNLNLFGEGVKVKISAAPWNTGPLSDATRVWVPVNIPWVASAT